MSDENGEVWETDAEQNRGRDKNLKKVGESHDWEEVMREFMDYLQEPVDNPHDDKGTRVVWVLMHSVFTLITMGVWILVWLGFVVFKFYRSRDLEHYKKNVYLGGED